MRAECSGVLLFNTENSALAAYYPRTVARLTRGHVGKVSANITPALYRQLTPGWAVVIQGTKYPLEAFSQFDIADEANSTTL